MFTALVDWSGRDESEAVWECVCVCIVYVCLCV